MVFYTSNDHASFRRLDVARRICREAILALGYETDDACVVHVPFFFYEKNEDQTAGYFRVVRIAAADFVKITTVKLAAEFATLYKDFETTGKLDVQNFTVYIGGGVALELSDDNFCAD